MIIPIPNLSTTLWQQPQRGHRVYFRIEHNYGICSTPCIAVYNVMGEKLGFFASIYKHAPALQIAVKYNLITGYVWFASKYFLLIEVVNRETEKSQDFAWSWAQWWKPNNTPSNN